MLCRNGYGLAGIERSSLYPTNLIVVSKGNEREARTGELLNRVKLGGVRQHGRHTSRPHRAYGCNRNGTATGERSEVRIPLDGLAQRFDERLSISCTGAAYVVRASSRRTGPSQHVYTGPLSPGHSTAGIHGIT